MKHRPLKLGHIRRVENKKPHQAANTEYWVAHLFDEKYPATTTFLFTTDQLATARLRADNNPEDVPPLSPTCNRWVLTLWVISLLLAALMGAVLT